jgi:hypothetical protein
MANEAKNEVSGRTIYFDRDVKGRIVLLAKDHGRSFSREVNMMCKGFMDGGMNTGDATAEERLEGDCEGMMDYGDWEEELRLVKRLFDGGNKTQRMSMRTVIQEWARQFEDKDF